MILSNNRQELISKLAGIFPGIVARSFSVESEGIPPTTTITVNKIGKQQLCDIAEVATSLEFDVEMKRSGTGISIRFV
jgi:hypothetical protein